MSESFPLLAIIAATFLLAGLVKGVIGLGLPTVAVGLLSVAMPPGQAAALLIVPSMVTNIWQMVAGPALAPLLRRFWPLLVGVCVGTWAGGAWLSIAHGQQAVALLGVALILYAAVGLFAAPWHVQSRWEPWLSPLVGALTGAVTAATGVFVIPAVPYLQTLGLEREALVKMLGVSFTVSTIALAALLAQGGQFSTQTIAASLLALIPALLGMAAGQWVRLQVSPVLFRRCFFLGLLALGLHLAVSTI